MSITSKVKAVLSIANKKQLDLITCLDVTSKQALYNKMNLDRWTGKDLVRVAELTGCKLAFVLPDGEHIFIDCDYEHLEKSKSQ